MFENNIDITMDNQQPSRLMGGRFNDQSVSSYLASYWQGKRRAFQKNGMKIWSKLNRNIQQVLTSLGFKWYYFLKNNTGGFIMKISLELVERFHEKWQLNSTNGCWEWIAALAGRGYGQIKEPGTRRQIYAHRLSYLIHYGSIPDGLHVLHVCDNPKCVKPSHLFLGTCKDNLQDMKNKDRHLKGERNTMAKLTDEKVRQIHTLNKSGLSQGKIAKIYRVSQGQIWRILHGIRWNHIFCEVNAG